jgi:hypothetical protein
VLSIGGPDSARPETKPVNLTRTLQSFRNNYTSFFFYQTPEWLQEVPVLVKARIRISQ